MGKKNPIIIPIASGKGGVGKTFITANLAMALAQMGHQVIAVDLDLGGSNLHAFLGLPNRFPGIGDFLKARGADLIDLLAPTALDNLKFLAGDGRTPFLANIPHAQKIRLISHIRKLPSDFILLDLGAGTTFNNLDFFRLAPNGLIVTTPELPTIFSMLAFLKHFILRALERELAHNHSVKKLLHKLYKQPLNSQQFTISDVNRKIAQTDAEAGALASSLCRRYRPRIVFNLGQNVEEIGVAAKIDQSLLSVLSLEADYFGFLFNDDSIRQTIQDNQAFLLHREDSLTAICLKRIAERVVRFWETPIKNSAELLARNTLQLQKQHKP